MKDTIIDFIIGVFALVFSVLSLAITVLGVLVRAGVMGK
jgi:hypothetical protein